MTRLSYAQPMLPIFRIISVGGVSLAILILALALMPPGGTRLLLSPHDELARGAMLDSAHHPEWRQFMMQAALRRADELERLRDLPSTPPMPLPEVAAPAPDKAAEAATPPANEAVAGLQSPAQPAPAEDVTGSINDNPGATIPIDIGETSSTELPVGPSEEKPPVSGVQDSRMPEPEIATPPSAPAVELRETVLPRAKPKFRAAVQKRPRHKKTAARARRAIPRAAAPLAPAPVNPLAALFGGAPQAPANAEQPDAGQTANKKRAASR